MTLRYLILKPQEVAAILEKMGFAEVRQRGSHKQFPMKTGAAPPSLTIPAETFPLYGCGKL